LDSEIYRQLKQREIPVLHREHDEFEGGWGKHSMKVKYRNPDMKAKKDAKGWFDANPDPDFKLHKAD
jgi:hypothetical protein